MSKSQGGLRPPASLPSGLSDSPAAEASRAVVRLAGLDPFVAHCVGPFMRREALCSSRLDGIEANAWDLVRFEACPTGPDFPARVHEVEAYIRAMDHVYTPRRREAFDGQGIRNLHRILVGARALAPGTARSQHALAVLENHLEESSGMHPLVRIGLAHAYFLVMRPFGRASGRVGRLLVNRLLCHFRLLPWPLLYLSAYFERHRDEYERRLRAVRDRRDWDAWIAFYLRGVTLEARDRIRRMARLMVLHDEYQGRVRAADLPIPFERLVDHLCECPALTVAGVARRLSVTPRAAANCLERLAEGNVVRELPTQSGDRLFIAPEIVRAIEADLSPMASPTTRPGAAGYPPPPRTR